VITMVILLVQMLTMTLIMMARVMVVVTLVVMAIGDVIVMVIVIAGPQFETRCVRPWSLRQLFAEFGVAPF
jgi:hypothetical protein